MLARDGYPAGVPCFIVTSQPDPQAAARFCCELFGWTAEDKMPAEAPGHYFAAQLDGRDVAGISSQSSDVAHDAVWSTYIAVDDADATVAKVREAGGSVSSEPFDVFDAGRMAVCADPQGAPFSLWRRPGYGDILERADPEIRERQGAVGAPAGFEDAIGWLMELADDEPAPHWAVTFAVDGTDAAADRAAELGASILVAPYEAGPTRIAHVRDPQGAAFTLSTYAPRA